MANLEREILGTNQKALRINLDAGKYGTFAEIGAGQEVARWFFRVGGAAGTIAKTISAYDMTFSDAIYGETSRYVSRQRLQKMLAYEYELLIERLNPKRGASTRFFVFADTVVARGYKGMDECHGWLGVQFQDAPQAAPSEIIIHVRMLDQENLQQQEALGIVGVNLIHGALYLCDRHEELIVGLLDNLSGDRVEVDMIKFTGPAFTQVDNRLASLLLVQSGLSSAAMFTAEGEVVQAAEVLYKKPILVERGTFRPVTHVTLDMLRCAQQQFTAELGAEQDQLVVLMEITLRNLAAQEGGIDPRDFLDRVDLIGAMGRAVLVSNYDRYFRVADYLFRATKRPVGLVMGVPALKYLFDTTYYTDLEGGILESFGRMFKNDLRLYVYPRLDTATGKIVTADNFKVAKPLRHLYAHLRENNCIRPLEGYEEKFLPIYSLNVLDKIRTGDPVWETMVPEAVTRQIKERKLFGCQ
jgi:hypothetical protein